jgi:hypothetical protein
MKTGAELVSDTELIFPGVPPATSLAAQFYPVSLEKVTLINSILP